MTAATIVVDVQNDFVDGSLGTSRGAEVAEAITEYLRGLPEGHIVVGTQDWHIDPAGHFAPPGEEPDYQNTWPVHCVAESHGAQIHENLDASLVQEWFHKGEYEPAYSGFEAYRAGAAGAEALGDWLRARGVEQVTVVGIATDFCVRSTALDAVKAGFATTVIAALCSPVTDGGGMAALRELADAGVTILR